jgi:hypothetical protein
MKRPLRGLILILFAICGLAWAQDQPQDQTAPAPEKPAKDKDKKKKEKARSNDDLNTEVFSGALANRVLDDLRDGLEGHSSRLLLSVFDGDKMEGYLSFEDQIESFFNRYAGFSVHYRIVNTSLENARGIVLVDFGLEEMPRSSNDAPKRKSGQLRFELERGAKGWKIVDFSPRGFFS